MLGEPNMADAQFRWPYRQLLPTQWAGLLMQRYMHETGATEETSPTFAEVQRAWALMNADALQTGPLSAEDYLALPYVTKPLRILDCDYPCDSGSAVIFTTEERARDLKQPMVLVDASALSAIHDMNFETAARHGAHVTGPLRRAVVVAHRPAARRRRHARSSTTGSASSPSSGWRASACAHRGRPADFVMDGNTRPWRQLPTNTDGGAINVGRRHGANFCIEAVRQLRGQCGERQVDGAEVSVWANAVGMFSGRDAADEGLSAARSRREVDDRTAAGLAAQDRREHLVEFVELDVVADRFEPGRLEVGRDPRPHGAAALDRQHHRVDAEQVHAAEDERQHRGRARRCRP